jgi:hypothetical protein
MGGYSHTFVPKADKYRTVPCKYYHGYFYINLVLRAATKSIIAHTSMMKDILEYLFLLHNLPSIREVKEYPKCP